MKRYLYFVIAMLGMSIMPSCNKEDTAATLDGKWTMVKWEFLFNGKVVGEKSRHEEWFFQDGELQPAYKISQEYSILDNTIYWGDRYQYFIEELGKSSLVLREPVTAYTFSHQPPSYVNSYDYDNFTLLDTFEGVNIYKLSNDVEGYRSPMFYVNKDNTTVIVSRDFGFGDFFFDSYRYHFSR